MQNVYSHGLPSCHFTYNEINELESTFNSDECIEYVKNSLLAQLDNKTSIGVFEKMISEGYDTLSDNQKKVVKSTFQQTLLKCSRCNEFLWEEADFIIENNLCTACQKAWDED